jgi:hypothetical protein
MGSEWILGRLAGGVWIGFDWLRIETGGGLLWVWWWTFGFLRHGIALKNLSPWLGLNSWTSCPMASMLTITPPRQHTVQLIYLRYCSYLPFISHPLLQSLV